MVPVFGRCKKDRNRKIFRGGPGKQEIEKKGEQDRPTEDPLSAHLPGIGTGCLKSNFESFLVLVVAVLWGVLIGPSDIKD